MRNNKNTKHSSDVARSLVGPLIVGVIVLVGQIFVNPMVARGVKREESILEQRYKACENAVNILHRCLAFVEWTGKDVPEWYRPPEKTRPTQVETNTVYTLLAIYGKNDAIADQFYKAAIGDKKIDPEDILGFVSAVRKELGVDEKGFTGKFKYIFVRQVVEDGQNDSDIKTGQKQ